MQNEFPTEQWIACFVRDGKKRFRRFYAAGYYNAYDKVMSYAESMGFDILWFKEKRYCDINARELEVRCVYCNSMIEESISILCHCNSLLCSKRCHTEHLRFRHHPKSNDSPNVVPAS